MGKLKESILDTLEKLDTGQSVLEDQLTSVLDSMSIMEDKIDELDKKLNIALDKLELLLSRTERRLT